MKEGVGVVRFDIAQAGLVGRAAVVAGRGEGREAIDHPAEEAAFAECRKEHLPKPEGRQFVRVQKKAMDEGGAAARVAQDKDRAVDGTPFDAGRKQPIQREA